LIARDHEYRIPADTAIHVTSHSRTSHVSNGTKESDLMRWKSFVRNRRPRWFIASVFLALAWFSNGAWFHALAQQPPEAASPAKPSDLKPRVAEPPTPEQTTSSPKEVPSGSELPPSASVHPLESLEDGANDPFLKTIQQRVNPLGTTPLSDPSGGLKRRTPQRIRVPGMHEAAPQRMTQRTSPVHPSASRRWLAAESMLRSARWLEGDATQADQAGRAEEAIALRSIAESLREQVQRLLTLPQVP
jgi:cytoskeletal protein RodZ